MADEYLTDDERAEELKLWWKENWAWVLSGVVLGIALLLGYQYYQRFVLQRAEAASAALNEYATLAVTDKSKAETLFKDLTDKYQATPYSLQAQLLKAQYAVDTNDFVGAEAALRGVMSNTKDPELAMIARLRLARVLIEQKKYDDALTLLDVSKAGGFAAQMQEVRGDALYARQDPAGAIKEYQAALAANAAGSADTSLLRLKLADLGVELGADAAVTVAGAGAP